MPRPGREPPRRLFRGPELTRLMSMTFMLVVLFMLIQRARTPDTWRWLVGHADGKDQVVGRESDAPKPVAKTPGHAVSAPAHPASAASAKTPANAAGNSGEILVAQATDQPKTEAAQNPPKGDPATPAKSDPAPPSTSRSSAEPAPVDVKQPAAEGKENAKVAVKMPDATGPTDEDPDEAGGALEDFDAINDRSIGIEKVEMPAYERIVRWVINQPEKRLAARVNRKDPNFGEFLQAPEEARGPNKIYQIDLNVRMMTKFDVQMKFNNSEDDPHDPVWLYDLWGVTQQSNGRLYQLVVFDPPEGMPLGTDVQEDVQFVGYFFKLQGYEPGRALPGHKLLNAPTLVGRILWKKRPADIGIQAAEWLWVVLVGGAVILGAAIWGSWLVFGKKKHSVAPYATELPIPATVTIDDWLEHAQDEPERDNDHDRDRDRNDRDDDDPDRESSKDDLSNDANGHSDGRNKGRGANRLFSDGSEGHPANLN